MTRSLAALSVSALVLSVALAAPVPKEKPAPLYFPTRVGDRWVLGLGETELTYVVTAVERKAGATVVTVGRPDQPESTKKVVVSGSGLYHSQVDEDVYDPSDCLLKLPLEIGRVWETDTALAGTRWRSRRVVRREEWVEVPAGRYKAVRVEDEITIDHGNGPSISRSTSWFAPRVGLVKMKGVGGAVFVLKSFAPGKE